MSHEAAVAFGNDIVSLGSAHSKSYEYWISGFADSLVMLHTLESMTVIFTKRMVLLVVQVEALGVFHHLGKFTFIATSKAKEIAGAFITKEF